MSEGTLVPSDVLREKVMDDASNFDETKGEAMDYTNMEPIFSTASGIRIEVSEEALKKTRTMLESNSSFSTSSVTKSKPGQFISPFRIEGQKSLKRQFNQSFQSPLMTNTTAEPPIKKTANTAGKRYTDLIGVITLVDEFAEFAETRGILQLANSHNLIVRKPAEMPAKLLLLAKIEIRCAQIVNECDAHPTEVLLEFGKSKLTILDSQITGIKKHSISMQPFLRQPCAIFELGNDPNKTKAVSKVQIIDFGPKAYRGCKKCKYSLATKPKKISNCPKCNSKITEVVNCYYTLIRVIDYSGQIQLHVPDSLMSRFLQFLGYQGIEEIEKFMSLQERLNYVFKPMMVAIEKTPTINNEWTLVDFDEVDWNSYGQFLDAKCKQLGI
ncbi:unnamed protein product [Caenorhabditis bovis]|uniref:Uncharacterized protein n=1 Tax=Caenorhabditis bovis TaxID=2654633 RepID=A0A8S1ERL7_9PELO|nr:unnamed protein product [Caenorhabditis bovis]